MIEAGEKCQRLKVAASMTTLVVQEAYAGWLDHDHGCACMLPCAIRAHGTCSARDWVWACRSTTIVRARESAQANGDGTSLDLFAQDGTRWLNNSTD
jgi:hypothetical protein